MTTRNINWVEHREKRGLEVEFKSPIQRNFHRKFYDKFESILETIPAKTTKYGIWFPLSFMVLEVSQANGRAFPIGSSSASQETKGISRRTLVGTLQG
jgi:hypothetical protein